ncbi:MAG: Hsp20/alpha crystallin family protein [Methylococcales bacterium]|nr:Hsp20/alpha crystallin family protein [Methylococcales bacterium]
MNNEAKKSTEVAPKSSAGSLMAFDEFDHFFDDFLSRKWPRLVDWNFPVALEKSFGFEQGIPKVDIIDRESEIEVQAALPGVKKEDLDVSINNQTITIRATTKTEKKEDGKYFRREITQGEFQRTLTLPEYVDNEHVKASFKDGILKVSIPKTEKGKRKTIEIK